QTADKMRVSLFLGSNVMEANELRARSHPGHVRTLVKRRAFFRESSSCESRFYKDAQTNLQAQTKTNGKTPWVWSVLHPRSGQGFYLGAEGSGGVAPTCVLRATSRATMPE